MQQLSLTEAFLSGIKQKNSSQLYSQALLSSVSQNNTMRMQQCMDDANEPSAVGGRRELTEVRCSSADK